MTERLRQHGTLGDVGGAAEITSLGIDGNPAPEVVRYNLGMLRDLEVKRRIARVGERMQRGQIEIEEACETLNEIRTRTYDQAKPLIEFRPIDRRQRNSTVVLMRTIRAAFERNAGQRLLDKLPMLVGEQTREQGIGTFR